MVGTMPSVVNKGITPPRNPFDQALIKALLIYFEF